jgi:hypothetical protein
MPKTVYDGDRSEADRIRDRLRPSSGKTLMDWPSDSTTTTQPTRTVTSVYHSSTQQNATVAGQPRNSRPQDVGIGGGFFTSDNDAWQREDGEKPKGMRLSGALFRPKR